MPKLCIFAHYDRDSLVDDYVVEYIKELKTVCDKIIFVSVSNVGDAQQQKLAGLIDKFINRENKGYDFGSWRAGLEFIGYDNLADYEELVLANDSCYASLEPFEKIFAKMKNKPLDAWSITTCYAFKYHMQSYFMAFKPKVFLVPWFKDFWNQVGEQPSKLDYIRRYEVSLSELIRENKCKIGAYVSLTVPDYTISLVKYVITIVIKKFTCRKYNSWCETMRANSTIKTGKLKRFLLLPKTAACSLNLSLAPSLKQLPPLLKVMLFRDNPYDADLEKIMHAIAQNNPKLLELIKKHQESLLLPQKI